MPPTFSGQCMECGAHLLDGMSYWERLGILLAREVDDPELQSEHFLTVASYNLQHPAQFTGEALAGLRSAFIEHLDHGLAVTEIRRRVGRAAGGNIRVLRTEAERQQMPRSWSMTIANVYLPEKPDGAAARARAWASSIRNEL